MTAARRGRALDGSFTLRLYQKQLGNPNRFSRHRNVELPPADFLPPPPLPTGPTPPVAQFVFWQNGYQAWGDSVGFLLREIFPVSHSLLISQSRAVARRQTWERGPSPEWAGLGRSGSRRCGHFVPNFCHKHSTLAPAGAKSHEALASRNALILKNTVIPSWRTRQGSNLRPTD